MRSDLQLLFSPTGSWSVGSSPLPALARAQSPGEPPLRATALQMAGVFYLNMA